MSVQDYRRQLKKFRDALPPDVRHDRRLSLSAFLASKKARIFGLSYYSGSPEKRRRGRREYLRLRSKILAKEFGRGRRRHVVKSPKLLLYRNKDDYLRDQLCPRFIQRWVPIEKRIGRSAGKEISLTDFSFARNPKGTLRQIRQIVRAAASGIGIRVNFTDTKCDDVAPYIVLSHYIRALPPVFSGGLITKEVATVLESVGLDKLLGVNRFSRNTSALYPILPFRMVFRAPPGHFGDDEHLLRPQYQEFVADKFCTAMNNWLDTLGFELTPVGAEALVVSVTEALDNAERHGSPEVDDGLGDWSMGGFARIVHTAGVIDRVECSVSIVSVGSTIANSLGTASPKVTELIDGYVNLQRREHGTNPELARTVVALQDGITRVEAASSANRGGIGLLTLTNGFAELGETDQPGLKSVFTILSGRSCLRLTAPYSRGDAAPGTSLRKLWFNDSNDGAKRPDANHAFQIDETFAGTVLSACFCIDPSYLQGKLAA